MSVIQGGEKREAVAPMLAAAWRQLAAHTDWTPTPAGRGPPAAFLFIQATTKRKQKVPCHCVEHTVTQVRRRLTTLKPYHCDSNFVERTLFRKLIAETLGPFLFPALIEGTVGFKTNNAYATSLRSLLLSPLVSRPNNRGSLTKGFVLANYTE
jgi:hypothetical protein